MKTVNITNNHLCIDRSFNQPIVILDKHENLTIEIKESVNVSIIELFIRSSQKIKREIIVNNHASLEYLKLQDVHASLQLDTTIQLKEFSNFNMINLELGKGNITNHFTTQLNENSAHFNVNALVKLYEKGNCASHFVTTHNAQSCRSSINYKHSLHDQSKAVFDVKTVVNNTALYSKAFQNSNTLLLSDQATIFAQPHLEILIDELQASHGAVTGSLDENQLLYLQSRGIPKEKAYDMLLKAFENEIYDNINDSKIKEFIDHYKRDDYV